MGSAEHQPSLQYRCLRCSAALAESNTACSCPQCGANWPIVDGIPIFFEDKSYYWGESGQKTYQQSQGHKMLEEARSGHWADVVRGYFDAAALPVILDLQRACWQVLLGLGPESVVLDIGSGWGGITHAVARTAGRVYSLEAVQERIRFTQERLRQEGIRNVQLVQGSALDVPFLADSFDVVVCNGILEWIGEWDLEGTPREAQLRFLSQVRRVLKDNGAVVIGIENRVGYNFFQGSRDHSGLRYTSLMPRFLATLLLRHSSYQHERINRKQEYRTYTYTLPGYRKLLDQAGFPQFSGYWSDPGYNLPYHLVPMSAREYIRQRLGDKFTHPRVVQQESWRRSLKKRIAGSGLLRLFVPEFVMIASRKSARTSLLQNWTAEALQRHRGIRVNPEEIDFYPSTGAFDPKYVLRLARPERLRGSVIIKAQVARPGESCLLADEYRNQELVSAQLKRCGANSAAVPDPMGTRRQGNFLYCMESGAKGRSLRMAAREPGYYGSQQAKNGFQRTVEALVELSKLLRDLNPVPMIDSRWYDLPQEVNRGAIRLPLPPVPSSGWVQNADMCIENVFVDRGGRVEVIDWAHLSGGLPALYDIFSLLASCRLPLASGRAGGSPAEHRCACFAEMFFSDRGFGHFAGGLLADAARACGLAPEALPALLLQFVVVRTNFYLSRRSAEGPIYLELLRFVLADENRRLFGRFPATTAHAATTPA